MRTLTVEIPFKQGLHARPASKLAKVCQLIKCDITLSKGETEVNPKSILGIMTLGAAYGSEVTFKVTGEDEEKAIISLESFFKQP